MRVAILAAGETVNEYAQKKSFMPVKYDCVWGLNQQSSWKGVELDKCFIMDDLKLRMPLYVGHEFTEWLKKYDKPIITSRAYPEWPTSVDYPIKEICHYFGLPLGISMYSTPDYMIAMAIYEGATHIDLYGVDLTKKNNAKEMHGATVGWCYAALARGIKITSQSGSWLQLFTNPGVMMETALYGYAIRPRIETLVNKDHYKEWLDARG